MPLVDEHAVEEGDPDRLRAQARELKSVASNIHTVTEMLQKVSTKGVWESGSGCAFAGEVGRTPETLYGIADRLGSMARVLTPHAEQLELAQRRMKTYRERYETNDRTADDKEAELRTLTPDDPTYSTVDREHREAANDREWAKRRYQREGERLHEDELSVARKLRALGEESTDRKGYDFFEGLTDLGNSAALNNPVVDWVKPVKTGTFAEPVGLLGKRMFYGEGSYTGVAKATGERAAGFVKIPIFKTKGSKQAAAQRKQKHQDTMRAVKAAGRGRSTNPIARKRLGENVRLATRQKTSLAGEGIRHRARETFKEETGIRLINDMTTDWAAIAGSGRVRKGVHVLRYTTDAGLKGYGTVNRAQMAGEKLGPLANRNADTKKHSREKKERAQGAN